MRQFIFRGCIGALCCLALLCCNKDKTAATTLADSNAALSKRIGKTIDDDEKKEKLEMLHAESKLRQLDLALIFAESGMQMRNKSNLTREEAESILKDSADKRAKTFQDVAKIRLEMRALVTEDEWNKIFEAKKEN
jgi:hypothetical protein